MRFSTPQRFIEPYVSPRTGTLILGVPDFVLPYNEIITTPHKLIHFFWNHYHTFWQAADRADVEAWVAGANERKLTILFHLDTPIYLFQNIRIYIFTPTIRIIKGSIIPATNGHYFPSGVFTAQQGKFTVFKPNKK